ncbi:hypothetical protein [Mycobacteroides abscessus]|uniref:hypothetical protein n=1 Tax=Mycobacteroides abscessus TaxID=36809 RepID=UPI000929A43C|nr:hypothetical protein [Mycobacteroides abscessus]DAZ90297.1 TPA_asm: hypothetical protein PROPHIFSQJ01-1_11 [Mycobacterium phage prophiFSQJ01-1]SII40213.1 Uncharacterised protein [Mycobacteroides abscessus subsp. abscessus]SIK15060.1 Uncharacterised protein [Mycobacteroides abscessus subsp. abscessus]SIN24833.1 Uncharacterised protein [Mycobacteroides abscessus subsp. abscessus]SLI52111.1 Uncharacterised protein [Mycobacteroides abscessus subsp. abscessus]
MITRIKQIIVNLIQPSPGMEARIEVDTWLIGESCFVIEPSADDDQVTIRDRTKDWPLISGNYWLATSLGRVIAIGIRLLDSDQWSISVGAESGGHDGPPPDAWDIKFRAMPYRGMHDPLIVVQLEEGEYIASIVEEVDQ